MKLSRRNLVIGALAVSTVTGASSAARGQKASASLVAYLTRSGNTRVIAGQISRDLGATCLRSELGPGDRIETRRMIVPEPLHDHGLAHPAVTINGDGGHSRAAWVVEEAAQAVEGLLAARIEHPSPRSDRPHAVLVILCQKRCASVLRWESSSLIPGQSVSSIKGTGLLESTPNRAP